MRTKKEILDEYTDVIRKLSQDEPRPMFQILEVLLDIRELLQNPPVEITGSEDKITLPHV